IPGSSPTMARRDPTRRLKSVDLPTLGRPTIVMSGARVELEIELEEDEVKIVRDREGQAPSPARRLEEPGCPSVFVTTHASYRASLDRADEGVRPYAISGDSDAACADCGVTVIIETLCP